METTYYSKILDNYLILPEDYKNKKICIEYSDGEFYNSMGEVYRSNIQLLKWGEYPNNKMFKEVEFLRIDPPREYLYPEDIPQFINHFYHLNSLNLPIVYGINLKKDTISSTVKHLTFVNDRNQTENLGSNKREIVKKLLFNSDVIESIIGISLLTLSSAAINVDGYLGFSEINFPNLEFLRCTVSAKDKYKLVNNFNHLKHLWVSVGKGVDLFNEIKSPLISLYIDGSNDLDYSKISYISTLEIIVINSAYSVIDCDCFRTLPHVKEITIKNSNFVKNITSLLEIPTLKSLELLDCKGALSLKEKQLFFNNKERFEWLSLEYA